MIDEKRPDVYLSADVSPDYENSSKKMKQDSTLWMSEGYIDEIFPMAYGEDLVEQAINKTKPFTDDHTYIYMGAGDFGVDVFEKQVVQSRDANIEGIVFFDYSLYKASNYITTIAETLYKNKAITPSHNSKAAVTALLSEAKTRITDLILPANGITQEQSNELTDIITAFETALQSSPLSQCTSLANSFYEKANSLITEDAAAKNAILNDASYIKKIAYLSNDNARAEYIAENPIVVTEPVDEVSEVESTIESEAVSIIESEANSIVDDKPISPYATAGFIAAIIVLIGGAITIISKRNKKNDTNSKA